MVAEGQLRWENRNLTNDKLLSNKKCQLKPWKKKGPDTLLPTWVYWLCSLVSTKSNDVPLWYIPNPSCTPWLEVEYRTSEKQTLHIAFSKKIWVGFEEWSDRHPEIYCHWIFGKDLLSQIISILIEKVISTKAINRTVKKSKNGNFLVVIDSWRDTENSLKMKFFHTAKCKPFLLEKLSTSTCVLRSRELTLATAEEIRAAMRKQDVTVYKRITIRKGEEETQKNTYKFLRK